MSNKRIITASEGHMLTNGEIYASSVRLGDWDSPDNWYEVTIEEYESVMVASEREVTKP